MNIFDYNGDDFKVLLQSEGWKIGFLRYSERFSKYNQLEKHNATDEAFAILCGTATLYTEFENVVMEKNKLYNIPKGEWHHIVVSKDATVIVIENSNTCKENTERKYF